MATTSHLGVISIPVDGAWDIDDLRALAESLSETYGLFYPLVAQDDDIRKQLLVLLPLSRVARSWIATSSAFIDLWAKVEKFFERRKHLRKPKKTIEVSDELADSSDEARTLVLEAGHMLGFDDASCEVLIGVAGNPISALKYLVAAANESSRTCRVRG
jgi:hypothetical protein